MASLNRVMLIGNMGDDPDMRYTAGGSAVCNFTLATNESWKDKDGNKQQKSEWHRVVMFGKLAEIAGQYLKKGSAVYIEGKLQTRKWQDKDGKDRYTTEIIADEMKMLGGGEKPQKKPEKTGRQQHYEKADFDDDIPF